MNKTILSVIGAVIVVVIVGVLVMPSDKNAETPNNDDTSNMEQANSTSTTPTSTTPTSTIQVSSTVSSTIGTVKEFTVNGSNFAFAPSTMTVKKGDTVKITFKNTGGNHDLKIDEFNVATKMIQGGAQETIQFVADKTGSFEYYCSVGTHRQMGMKGTLIVQ